MGVPKFYRWLSERYPQINTVLSDKSLLPEFDNMYLDMNGIIHACTHPNDDATSSTLSLREMMLAIFRYIDRMVSEIAKPRKILFMAIDGCAPRAKMNQQRSRRFRSAQDRMESIDKARQNGELIDESTLFDSNCITPGTEFMEQVGKHLRWFIRKKIKEDPIWRNLEIVFSGHDVPGEGEHKIMQFIRELRARPDYEPNQRHCMYGGDADLIMLGLATHEPHFCLLREVVNFNRSFSGSAKQTVMRQTKEAQFQLMHISIVREYIELDLSLGCGREVNKERLCDDFIFLTFLVGNDFLPHLPTLDIGEHAFDVVFSAYKQVLASGEDYLVTDGELRDMKCLQKLFMVIGEQEAEILANREVEDKKFKSKKRGMTKAQLAAAAEAEEEAEEEKQRAYEEAIQEALAGGSAIESTSVVLGTNEEGEETQIKDYRGRYYFEKFKIVPGVKGSKSANYLYNLTEKYMEGLMWCLAYYIKGCISWTWYYPYNYGPMLIDMVDLEEKKANISFDLGHPFRPFQQLLGCLPPLSKRLLPASYQWIMVNEDSPVKEFYPNDFVVDQDGKKNPWEAVVLLPFIDEKRLLDSESKFCPADKLTTDERARNSFGKVLSYHFDPTVTETYFSCNPEIGLPDVQKCFSVCVESDPEYAPGHSFEPEVIEGTVSPLPGFPSLGVLPIVNVETEFQKVNCFGSESKYRTISVEFQTRRYNRETLDISKLIGRPVHVNYPAVHEAMVVAVSNNKEEYRSKNGEIVHVPHHHAGQQKWIADAEAERERYLKGRSLPGSGGLSIGAVEVLLRVVALQGMKRDPITGANKKQYGTTEASVPIQMALWKPPAVDPRFIESGEASVASMFPKGVAVVGVQGRFRGVQGTVVGHHGGPGAKALADGSKEARSVDVRFSILPPEPAFGYIVDTSVQEEYFSSQEICRALRISSNVLGKIVGALFVDHPKRYDVGLNLRRHGQYSLLGYAKVVEQDPSSAAQTENTADSVWQRADVVEVVGTDSANGEAKIEEKTRDFWQYSAKAVDLILEYRAAFPVLFRNLESLEHAKKYTPKELLGANGDKEIVALNDWLSAQPCARMARTPLTTACLSKEAVRAIERAGDVRTSYLAASGEKKITVSKVPLEALYRGDAHVPTDVPLAMNVTAPRLGDRVVNLNATGVPFGQRGTVVAVHSSTGYVEVLYDDEFVGGRPLQGTASQFRGRLCPWSGLLCIKKAEVAPALENANGLANASLRAANAKHANEKRDAVGGKKEKDTNAKNSKNNSKPEKEPPSKATNLLKQKLNIGSSAGAVTQENTLEPSQVAVEATVNDVVQKLEKVEIVESDGSGRAALLAAAGEEFDFLLDLPFEPELAGVIQYMPIVQPPKPPAKQSIFPTNTKVKAVTGGEKKGPKDGGNSKFNPKTKPETTKVAKGAIAVKIAKRESEDLSAAFKNKLKVSASGGEDGLGKKKGSAENAAAEANEAPVKKSATAILKEHIKLKKKGKEDGARVEMAAATATTPVADAVREPVKEAKESVTKKTKKDEPKASERKEVKAIKPLVPSSMLYRKKM